MPVKKWWRTPDRAGKLEVPAVCLGNALGGCGSGTVPLWVAATIASGLLSTSRVGWLASGELFSMAVSALAVSAWGRRGNPRTIAAVSASAAVIANVVSMFPMARTLVIGRLASGLAMGVLQASLTGVAARRPDAQRVLALMQAVFVLLASIILFVSPYLIGRFGAAGLFAVFAGIGMIALLGALVGLPATRAANPEVAYARSTLRLAPLLSCLALGTMIMGVNVIWVYIIAIGSALGMDAHTLGVVLAFVLPLAMLGPIAAHRLSERIGLLCPLVFGLVLMAIDGFFIVIAASPILFCIATSALIMAGFFCVPYAIAQVGRLDASGSFGSAAPVFMMIGNAMAPAIGSKLANAARFEALAVLTALCMALCIALFSVAAGLGYTKVVLRERDEAG